MSEKNEGERLPLEEADVMAALAPDPGIEFRNTSPPATLARSVRRAQPAGGGAVAAAPGGLTLKYYFSLKADLTHVSNKEKVGFEVPEGIRLHINYKSEDDQVFTDPPLYLASWGQAYSAAWANAFKESSATPAEADLWHGMHGKIRSGGDWVLVQKDGVARFDARVTIQSADNVLVDAIFTGAVDLRPAVAGLAVTNAQEVKTLGRTVYDAYLNKDPAVPQLPVALSVRFEGSEQPYLRPGEDGAWIAKSRYAQQSKNFWRYQKLVRSMFVARGSIALTAAKQWPPTAIDLAIYELA
jgi:Protein of unknown function (DUF3237)